MSTNITSAPALEARLDYMRQAPTLFKKFLDFSMAIDIDPVLAHLIDLRASQLNGCAFCVDMHVKQAAQREERELRLHHVAIWHESPLFTPRERAALAWTEALTRLSPHGITDELFAQVSEHFTEQELAQITFKVMSINGWNRINVAFRPVPGSKDQAFGLDKARLR